MSVKGLLIPFGYSNKTGEIIEPHEADQGRACDAYCPGCDTPLISRHPQDADSRIHFAHDSKHPKASKEAIRNCPFNGPLAITLMARSIAPNLINEEMTAPKLEKSVACGLCQTIVFSDCIPVKGSIKIQDIASPHLQLGAKFDIKIDLDGSTILIWLAYADRPVPDIDFKKLDRVGAIKIEVNSFDSNSFKKGKNSFQEAVKGFLLSGGKREWIHHPSEDSRAIKAAEKKSHSCVAFECSRCNIQWFHNIKLHPECPNKCPTRYIRKSIKQPDIPDHERFIIIA